MGKLSDRIQIFNAYDRSDAPPRAVVLVFHGLNLKPSKMDSIAQCLSRAGAEVFRPELAGHTRAAFRELVNVSAATWREEARTAFKLASERASELSVPLHLVGFSLGGLLIQHLLSEPQLGPVAPTSVTYFAPALALQKIAGLIPWIARLGRGLTIPSLSPSCYRVHFGTPMGGYRAILDLVFELDQGGWVDPAKQPKTLVFISPRDELVNARRLIDFGGSMPAGMWEVVEVRTLGQPEHLIVDSDALGVGQWGRVEERLLGHMGFTEARTSTPVRDTSSPELGAPSRSHPETLAR